MELNIFKCLIDVKALYDINVGIVNYVKHNLNKSYFDQQMLEQKEYFFRAIMMTSDIDNILEYIMIPKCKKDAKNIFIELIEKEFSSIINDCPTTNILDMLKTIDILDNTVGIRYTIYCGEPYFRSLESAKESALKNILAQTHSNTTIDTDVSNYDRIIVSDLSDLNKFIGVEGKNILFQNYRCNFETTNNKLVSSAKVGELVNYNEFDACDTYNNFVLPVG